MEQEKKIKKEDKKPKRPPKNTAEKPKTKTRKAAKNDADQLSGAEASKRKLIIFTSIFLGLVLLFGIIFGVIAIVRNVRSVMIYKGVTIDKGVANYLVMMGKYNYMVSLARQGIPNSDTPQFWNSRAADGRTYGDILKAEVELYIKKVMVGVHLFDQYATLSAQDEKAIENTALAVLTNYGGDKSKMDKDSAELGFDFDDIYLATEMIYKYKMAKDVIFGEDAYVLKAGGYEDMCNEFFGTYTHAKLLFIRNKNTEDMTEDNQEWLTDEEIEEANAEIENVRALINGNTGAVWDSFNQYISKWSQKDEMNVVGGYYFSPTSSDTAGLMNAYPGLVEAVYDTELNTFREVETPWGVCFIYRDTPANGAYQFPSLERFFSDFYTDAANYIYHSELTSYSAEVKVKKKFYDINIIDMPYNIDLLVRI